MDAGLDTGPLVSQCRTPIQPADNSATLHDRLARLGAELLVRTIPDFVAGRIQPQSQADHGATYAPKIKKEDGRIDWKLPAKTIMDRLRAFTPWPGAFTYLSGAPLASGAATPSAGSRESGTANAPKPQLLKIWKVEIVTQSGEPGTILSADKHGLVVAGGQDALRVLELQREGGRRMPITEFLAGHPLKAGERLG